MNLPQGWPNSEFSQFVAAGDLDWHVQLLGVGPKVLLLHGTGSSAHSWSPLTAQLAKHAQLIIPDLPGHGFTSGLSAEQTTLPGVCEQIVLLLDALELQPQLVIGHSAGAAIGAELSLGGWLETERLIAINGAFLPFGSVAAPVFSRMAKFLANNTVIPAVTSWHGYFERPIRNLLRETGSEASPEMIGCYKTLLKRRSHVEGTLRMMAGWDLNNLKRALPGMKIPMDMVVCENDKTLSPWQLERLSEFIVSSELHRLPGLGHLGHEESPEAFIPIIERAIENLEQPTPGHCAQR